MVCIIYSDAFLDHDTGGTHPECPERLTTIATALRTMPGANYLHWQIPTPVGDRDPDPYILQCHSPGYLKALKTLADAGGGSLDMDTPVSAQSYEVARLAVNAWLDGVDHVVQDSEPAFVLARPPVIMPSGKPEWVFVCSTMWRSPPTMPCNNRGSRRWQFWIGMFITATVPKHWWKIILKFFTVLCINFPAIRGSGQAGDRGKFNNVLNIPLKPGGDRRVYQKAFNDQVVPFLTKIKPDLLLVSAGYDANQADPLAYMNLTPQDYGMMSHYLLEICPRLVLGLEGGYHLQALGRSVVETLKPLLA